jgi:hypothetical protein
LAPNVIKTFKPEKERERKKPKGGAVRVATFIVTM